MTVDIVSGDGQLLRLPEHATGNLEVHKTLSLAGIKQESRLGIIHSHIVPRAVNKESRAHEV